MSPKFLWAGNLGEGKQPEGFKQLFPRRGRLGRGRVTTLHECRPQNEVALTFGRSELMDVGNQDFAGGGFFQEIVDTCIQRLGNLLRATQR